MKLPLLAPVIMLALAGCAQPNRAVTTPALCQTGETMTQTTLYFGLNRPQGPVISEAEWQRFVDQDVTLRFKEGLTVFNASGQWLGNDGKLARENSKALMLIHAADRESGQKIEALREIYKQRFSQDAVMRVDTAACVAF